MYTNRYLVVILTLLLGTACCATGPKVQLDKPIVQLQCKDIENVKSIHGDEKYEIEFVNSRDDIVDIYWVNYEGEEELKQTMSPSERWMVTTYVTHPWVVRDKSGKCLALYNSRSNVYVEIQ